MSEEFEKRPRILIVEHDQKAAESLDRILQDLGYEAAGTAGSGDSAVKLAETEKPDLVLMDIDLPGQMDGIEAAAEIGNRWQLPVIFMTASTDVEVLDRAREAGPYGFLIKPVRPGELSANILVALRQHRVTRELFSEHAWLRTLLSSLSDGVIATDAEARVTYLNPVAERLTGWTLKDAFGKPIDEVFVLSTPTGERVEICQLKKALEFVRPVGPTRFWLVPREGQRTPIEDSASPILDQGRPTGAVSIFLDITERLRQERQAELIREQLEERVQLTTEALGETRTELQALSGHLLSAQEEEKRKLAGELHDDFGQRTALLELHVSRALEFLPAECAEVEHLLHQMHEQISALGAGLRNVSHGLHPSVLADLGLASGLVSLVQDFKDLGMEASVRVPDDLGDVPLHVAIALYRIAQEALRNAMKHAPGVPVRLVLDSNTEAYEMTIEDAGPGFDVGGTRQKGGLGLLSIKERARSIGGTLLLHTHPGEGTSLTVRVPR